MPGMSTGLAPIIVGVNTDLSADTNIPVCKFPTVSTRTDHFVIAQSALTGNSTDFATMRNLNGKTTGNQTTNLAVAGASGVIGGASVSWVAYTAKTNGTNYTFSANHWSVFRTSEDGTVALGTITYCAHVVQGNV
ncbi:MAG: hypothetical protein IT318_20330 [Anaerolineales bacterium]|nr:hypothetical protein [Anaerolineales bacterium]